MFERLILTKRLFLILLTISIIAGCLMIDPSPLATSHNPKLRLDLSPLTNEQVLTQINSLQYGSYRVQPHEIISALYPNSLNRKMTANLPQSSCLWLGDAGGRGGDWLDASWEATLQLDSNGEDFKEFGLTEETNDFGLCDWGNPTTRLPWNPGYKMKFEELDVLINGQPVTVYNRGDNKVNLVFLERPGVQDKTFYGVNSYGTANLEETTHTAPLLFDRTDQTSYGDCSSLSFDSSRTEIRNNTTNSNKTLFSCPSSEYWITGCALRCQLKPSRDAQYKLNYRVNDANNKVVGLETKFMRVPSSNRTIARQMTRIGSNGNYQWQVTTKSSPSDSLKLRWDENFTPNVLIKNVKFFYLNNNTPVDLAVGGINILTATYENALSVSCQSDQNGNFAIGDDSLFPHPCGQAVAMTPTYNTVDLSELAGNVLSSPLQWNINFPNLTNGSFANTKVFIEFELETRIGEAALMFEEQVVEFETEQGSLQQFEVRLKNAGYQPIEINDISLMDNHQNNNFLSSPNEFRFKLLSNPQIMPFPITGSTSRGTPTSIHDFKVALSHKESSLKDEKVPSLDSIFAPIFTLREDDNLYKTIHRNNLNDQTHIFEDEEVSFDGKFGFYQNSKINFEESVRSRLVNPKAELPFGQVFYKNRTLPFVLAPGESQEMLVSFIPNSWGNKAAKIVASGNAIGTATKLKISMDLIGSALANATAIPFPENISLPRYQPNTTTGNIMTMLGQTMLLINNGQTDLQRNAFNITGPLSGFVKITSEHLDTFTVIPGYSETFQISLLPRNCSQLVATISGNTQLEITTSSGFVVVPIDIDLSYCVAG